MKHSGGSPRVSDRPEWLSQCHAVLERVLSGNLSLGKAARILKVGKTTMKRLKDGKHISQKGTEK